MFVFSGIKYSKLLTFAKTIFLYKHEQTFNFTLQILSTYTCQFIIKDFILFQVLAKKMTVLYKLAREQLSKQSHYDFGLRALKSVLVMAGELKRGSPDLSEVETIQCHQTYIWKLLWFVIQQEQFEAWCLMENCEIYLCPPSILQQEILQMPLRIWKNPPWEVSFISLKMLYCIVT